jgi:L-ascorbate metabolism protein UlaG (beta-lactamase superfamily)
MSSMTTTAGPGLALLLVLHAAPSAADGVRVTYLANEGVRIEGGTCDVLIDALLRDSLGDYVRHDPAAQESLETGRPPFDGVKLALATHFHLDHWDAGAIARFLTNRPAAVFGSPPQAGAMLPSALKRRVRPLWPVAGQPAVRLAEGGAVVDAIPLDHGMPVENMAYRLECGGRVLFHMGDSKASEANFAILAGEGQADVALVPHWWLTDNAGLAFLRDRWRPRHVVAFHLGESDVAAASTIQARLPQAWVCTRRGESRTY